MAAPHDLPLGKPTASKTPVPVKTVIPRDPKFYTKRAQALAVLNQVWSDERGLGLKFQAGRGYYLGAAGNSSGGGAATLPPPVRHPSYTPAQEATIHARQLLAPQYAQASAEAAQQNKAIQAYTTAVMQQLAGLAPAIGQDYNNAINAQSGMVNAAADSLRAANPSGDVAKLLDAVGAPAAQNQQIQGNLSNVFNGGAAVGQYVNGVSPLGALRAQGLAAESLARLQPGFASLAGRQSLLSALKQQGDTRAQIGAQMPKLEQDWLSSFQDNKAKQQQLALEAQAAGLKQANTDRSFAAQQQKFISDYNLRVKEFNAKQTATAQKAALPNASLSRANGYLTDSKGNPILDSKGKRQILPGFSVNAQGRVIKTPKSKSTKAGTVTSVYPNLTKSQVQHLRSGIAAAFYGVPEKTKPDGTVVSKALPPIGYQQAITEMVKGGYSRAAATKMANRFYAPGKRGRPRR